VRINEGVANKEKLWKEDVFLKLEATLFCLGTGERGERETLEMGSAQGRGFTRRKKAMTAKGRDFGGNVRF